MSLKRQTTMNYFVVMHHNLLLNKELNEITLQLSNKARYSVINDFWKLLKWIKTLLKSKVNKTYIRRFLVINYEPVFIRVCKLPTVFIWHRRFLLLPELGEVESHSKLSYKSLVTAKFICNTLISYDLTRNVMQYFT